MAIAPFLAMTAAEIYNCPALPPKIAWMACHFSPYGLGLSNLPKDLPPGSLLMVDDITPPHGHDPSLIAQQLTECVASFRCCGILLDFQRIDSRETQVIVKHLISALPCPVAVPEAFARGLDCPVFLSLLPPSEALKSHLKPWLGREIWMEIGLTGEEILLTETGSNSRPFTCPNPETNGFSDKKLHCHYTIETKENSAGFTLWRRKEDLKELMDEAEVLGVSGAIGLYQELKA